MGRSGEWRISPREFEKLVEEAVAELPRTFLDLLDNVVIVVEEEPSEEDLGECEIDEDDDLLGIYRGIPLGDRGFGALDLPDQIAIFRGPILRLAGSRDEAVEEIRDTVVHELGHHFGLSDEEMPY
jgi:predicted Zn-dependent protease with MMP-like domain